MRLFKYRSLSSAKDNPKKMSQKECALDILKNNQLYLSPPTSLNDPFDCRPPITATDDEIVSSFRNSLLFGRNIPSTIYFEQLPILVPEVRKEMEETPEKIFKKLDFYFRVLSLTQVAPINTENSDHILLWSHYADSHKGICLEFNGSLESLTKGRHQVTYDDKTKVRWFSSEREEIGKALKVKANAWAYEKEHRVIAITDPKGPAGGRLLKLEPSALVAVYFGLETSDGDIKEITEVLKESASSRPNSVITLFGTKRENNLFGLKPVFKGVVVAE